MQPLNRFSYSGRLLLPEPHERRSDGSVPMQILNAPDDSPLRPGDTVRLNWSQAGSLGVVTDMSFSPATQAALQRGDVVPERLQGWKEVQPLESLAGARSEDAMVVGLSQAGWDGQQLRVNQAPVEISGPQRLAVQVVDRQGETLWGRDPQGQLWKLPTPARPERVDLGRWVGQNLWVYGQQSGPQQFEVASMLRQSQLGLQPDQVYRGPRETQNFLRHKLWAHIADRMNETRTVLLSPTQEARGLQDGPILGLHLFGGYQGPGGDPPRPLNLVGGHFAFATGQVRQGELEVNYHQVYGQNPDQIVSATQSQEAYLGSLQRGWQYTRPVVDLLIQHPALRRRYEFGGALNFEFFPALQQELERMQARYRVGDGDGVAEIQAATNCSQDSASAMYAVVEKILELDRSLAVYPQEEQYRDFRCLVAIAQDLKKIYAPFGRAPQAWEDNRQRLPAPAQMPVGQQALQALGSWKTILPRTHHEAVAEVMLRHGAQVLVKSNGPLGAAEAVEPPTTPTRI